MNSQTYNYTRPLKRQRVDLPTAVALLRAAGFSDLSLIRAFDLGEYTLEQWGTARSETLGETYAEWLRMRYELSTARDLSAPRVFHPVLVGYENGLHMAVIWIDLGDHWRRAYAVVAPETLRELEGA